jgi:hypothetical protein
LVDTDDESEARDHKILVRWIRHFMEVVPEKVQGMYELAQAESRGDLEGPDTDDGGSPYMEGDGGAEEAENVD